MVEFLSVFHVIITIVLCGLVLVQDSKGGGALGIGGGSNSVIGATTAQSLASNLTKWTAVLFAASCIALTYFIAHQEKSVVDKMSVADPAKMATPATQTQPAGMPVSTDGVKTETKDAAPATDAKKDLPAEPAKK